MKNKDIINQINTIRSKIIDSALPIIREDINNIITNKIKSQRKIENTLDQLLEYINLGIGEEEFKRLNNYYSTIDKENSKHYNKYLNDILSD